MPVLPKVLALNINFLSFGLMVLMIDLISLTPRLLSCKLISLGYSSSGITADAMANENILLRPMMPSNLSTELALLEMPFKEGTNWFWLHFSKYMVA